MLETGITAIAYETLRGKKGDLPCLAPMSEIAGRMRVQAGAKLLERPQGGRGMLLGGVPCVPPADVVILGRGMVGKKAADAVSIIDGRLTSRTIAGAFGLAFETFDP